MHQVALPTFGTPVSYVVDIEQTVSGATITVLRLTRPKQSSEDRLHPIVCMEVSRVFAAREGSIGGAMEAVTLSVARMLSADVFFAQGRFFGEGDF